MPRRIVIHAGFHKTGTSSVQQALRQNRPVLKPYLRSLLKGQMQPLISAARGYSTWGDTLTLEKFRTRFRALLADLDPMPRRVLCLSAEELSGHLPGRGELRDYAVAPVLAATMAEVFATQYPHDQVTFFYSTRAPDAWLRSAYWEHVRSASLTLDWADYAAQYAGSADLDGVVTAVDLAQPYPAYSTRLEDDAGGPLARLLDLCEVPAAVRDDLIVPPPANRSGDDTVLQALLDANRAYADPVARAAAKQSILRQAQEALT
jgi:hypothetical protein